MNKFKKLLVFIFYPEGSPLHERYEITPSMPKSILKTLFLIGLVLIAVKLFAMMITH